MKGFSDQAAITGVGETDFVKGTDRTAVDMMLEASRRAIADAGLKPSDIDGMVPPPIYTTSEELAANLGIDVLRYAATVHMGGASPTTALQNAAMAIAAGLCDHVLVTLGWNGFSALRPKPGAPRTRAINMNTLTNTIQGYYIPYSLRRQSARARGRRVAVELHVPTRADHRRGHRANPEEHHRRARAQHAARAAARAVGGHSPKGSRLMDFGLSPEQEMLKDAVRRCLAENCPLDHVRTCADSGSAVSEPVAAALHAMGLSGLMVPEAHGGLGMTLLDAAVMAEELGRAVAPVPFVARSVLAPLALVLAGSDAQQANWLPRIVAGEARFGVAISGLVETRDGSGVQAGDDGLSGTALFAFDFEGADHFIVADDAGRLHLVAADADGVERVALKTIDLTRSVGELRFAAAHSEPLADDGGAAARRLRDAGRVLLAADSLGAAETMIEKAVAYAGEREQFGRVIASFQAVKHMCAEMAARHEPCRALVWYAAHAFDTVPDETALMACHAKSHTGEVHRFVARTATEVHGGMGFTDLLGLHYWFKRIGFDRQVFGGPERVRADAAQLQGWVAAAA